MNFNEFHNSSYWEQQRSHKAGQITLVQLVMILSFGMAFFGLAYLLILE